MTRVSSAVILKLHFTKLPLNVENKWTVFNSTLLICIIKYKYDFVPNLDCCIQKMDFWINSIISIESFPDVRLSRLMVFASASFYCIWICEHLGTDNKKNQCLKRLFVTASGIITPSNFSMLMRSYQISPSTKLVVEGGGIRGIIQQKFSSSIFCRSSSRMNRDIHSLMLPVQPFLCQQPNKAFFMQAVWWEWESRNSYFPSSSRERDSSQGGILRLDRGPHHQAGYQHVRTLLCATEDHHL